MNETMSSYLDVFRLIFQTAVELWPTRRITSTFLPDFVTDMRHYGRISTMDIATVASVAVVFTLLRCILTRIILTPFAEYMKLSSKSITKFPESFWKFTYYLVMFMYASYLLFVKKYPYFEDPRTNWPDWSVGMDVPTDIYYLYCIQASFYFHSIYATLYLDPWRKDFIAMLIHHFLTLFLICFSYAVRYYKVGVVVLFLHDGCDVALEFTKLCVCWKVRNNKRHFVPELLINTGFLLFAFSWFYCRLYLFPYKVLYSTGHYAPGVIPHAPFYYFFNGMLLFLYAMNVYWFHFIILLIWRVATGKSREVEDTREVGVPAAVDSVSQDANSQISRDQTKLNGTVVVNGKEKIRCATKNSNIGNEVEIKGQDKNGFREGHHLKYRQSDKAHQ